jgi:hypothetical protein
VTAGCCGGVGCANIGAAAHAAVATISARVLRHAEQLQRLLAAVRGEPINNSRTNGYERIDIIDVCLVP